MAHPTVSVDALNAAVAAAREEAERLVPALAAEYAAEFRRCGREAARRFQRYAWEAPALTATGGGTQTLIAAAPAAWRLPHGDELHDKTKSAARLRDTTQRTREEIARLVVGGVTASFGVSFDVANPVIKGVVEQLGEHITRVTDTQRRDIMQSLERSHRDGLSIRDAARRLVAESDIAAVRRGEVIARTEFTRAANMASLHAAGLVAPTGMMKRWLCVAPWTRVKATGVTHLARRRFDGELVTVYGRPAGRPPGPGELDRHFTVTAEHEVLTARGWIAAERLQEGDKMIGRVFDEGDARCDPDVDGVPPTISEAFRTAAQRSAAVGVMGGVVDLDGDVPDGEVEVVPVTGELLPDVEAAFSEPSCERLLAVPDVRLGALLGLSPPPQIFARHLLPALYHALPLDHALPRAGVVDAPTVSLDLRADTAPLLSQDRLDESITDPVATLQPLRGHAATVERRDLCLVDDRAPLPDVVPEGDAFLKQDRTDEVVRHAEGPADPVDGLAGLVETHDVVGVVRRPWNGHVYDVTTLSGWFLADGYAVHNCSPGAAYPRHELHIAELEAQVVPLDGLFDVSGYPAKFPGDPELPPSESIMCRCTLIYQPAEGAVGEEPPPPLEELSAEGPLPEPTLVTKLADVKDTMTRALARRFPNDSPADWAKGAENWTRNLRGSIENDRERLAMLRDALAENRESALYQAAQRRFGDDIIIPIRRGYKKNPLIGDPERVTFEAHRNTGGFTFIFNVTEDRTPGYLAQILRHEYGHQIFPALTRAEREEFLRLLPAGGPGRASLSSYANMTEEMASRVGTVTADEEAFAELFRFAGDPAFDATKYDMQVRQAARWLHDYLQRHPSLTAAAARRWERAAPLHPAPHDAAEAPEARRWQASAQKRRGV